jgi:hypothetical protein
MGARISRNNIGGPSKLTAQRCVPDTSTQPNDESKHINQPDTSAVGFNSSSHPQPAPARRAAKLPLSAAELYACGVSESQLSAVLCGMQALREAGLVAEDIADVILNDPRVLDLLRFGDYEEAKQLALCQVAESVAKLQASGVPEDRLRELADDGFAVGEIAWVIRNIVNLRETLAHGNRDEARLMAPMLHAFFRKGGRPNHGRQKSHRATGLNGSWLEEYSRVITEARQSPNIGTGTKSTKPEPTTGVSSTWSAPPKSTKIVKTVMMLFGPLVVMGFIAMGIEQLSKPSFSSPAPPAWSPCAVLQQEGGRILERQTEETRIAEDAQDRQMNNLINFLERSGVTEEQRGMAIRNLAARQDIANTAREARQNSEFEAHRQRSRQAGCLAPEINGR